MPQRLAVCSWSLQANSPTELVDRVRASGLYAIQLALDPIRTHAWGEEETVNQLTESGIEIVSGMMITEGEDYSTLSSIRETGGLRPDHTWMQNLRAAEANADIAARLRLNLITLHAGFIPHDRESEQYSTIVNRLRRLADIFAEREVRLGLETGQETAGALRVALADIDHPCIGVNFDPANMILYGMGDPVEAVVELAPHILQVHIKDAISRVDPDEWGHEVPVGSGDVDWARFFRALEAVAPRIDLVIEREAGHERIMDIRIAADMVSKQIGLSNG